MNWGKIVLLFQAIITLIIGLAFFSQTINLNTAQVFELKFDANQNETPEEVISKFTDIKYRFTSAFFILIIISLIEIIIITRLFNVEASDICHQ